MTGEALVDDGDSWGGAGVAIGELTTFHDRGGQRRKVAGRDRIESNGFRLARTERIPFDGDTTIPQ